MVIRFCWYVWLLADLVLHCGWLGFSCLVFVVVTLGGCCCSVVVGGFCSFACFGE